MYVDPCFYFWLKLYCYSNFWGDFCDDRCKFSHAYNNRNSFQSVIKRQGFRSLGDDELVEFKAVQSGKGLEAVEVRGVAGKDCQGSHRRPGSKKKFKKLRCYNCGEFTSHLASQCSLGPLPKRCHHCKAEDHLIEDCPTLPDEKKKRGPGRGDEEKKEET